MPPIHRFAPLFCVLLFVGLPAMPAGAAPHDTWLGIYFSNRKIGYTNAHSEDAEFRGKPAIKLSVTGTVRMEMFGQKVSQDTTSTTWTDSSWHPLYQEYQMSSNGSVTKLRAEYLPDKIVCTVGEGAGSVKEVPVPPGANLSTDSPDLLPGEKVAVGKTTTVYTLNPLTLTLDRSDITVQDQADVKLAGTSYHAYRTRTTSVTLGAVDAWQSVEGDVLKCELPLGMQMYREAKERALDLKAAVPSFVVSGGAAANGAKAAYTPPSDFAVATAIKTDRPIPAPRSAKSLALMVSGIEDPHLILSDSRQHAEPVKGAKNTYRISLSAGSFDPAKSAKLPITDAAVQEDLKPAPYLETGDASIQETAQVLRGKETNAYKVAVAICDWVHQSMRPDYTIGIPRSCVDVYKKRRGVCRDYATLFAGIARAAGIPTRVVGGMVYSGGRFFYHAWAECWVGAWVPLDPTQGGSFVDATHVKFAQGGVTDMFNVGSVIGRIKVKVEPAH